MTLAYLNNNLFYWKPNSLLPSFYLAKNYSFIWGKKLNLVENKSIINLAKCIAFTTLIILRHGLTGREYGLRRSVCFFL